jgi:hypothetical protein
MITINYGTVTKHIKLIKNGTKITNSDVSIVVPVSAKGNVTPVEPSPITNTVRSASTNDIPKEKKKIEIIKKSNSVNFEKKTVEKSKVELQPEQPKKIEPVKQPVTVSKTKKSVVVAPGGEKKLQKKQSDVLMKILMKILEMKQLKMLIWIRSELWMSYLPVRPRFTRKNNHLNSRKARRL